MKTLLFIENRYKTYFFEAIVNRLSEKGFDIHFLIQNDHFLPKLKVKKHIISYPKKTISYSKNEAIELIIASDRQQNHFKKKDQSYFYYYHNQIDQVLQQVKPDVVFGESTAFHELLTINLCKQNDILYLNPSTCRYPLGRFSFYKYDTLEPYKGSEELLSEEDAKNTVKAIVNRTAKPDYMKAVSISKSDKIKDKLKLVSGFAKGERFNTPNPVIKYQAEQVKTKNIAKWDAFASMDINTDKFVVLYPLQMQPEANIDVWGRPYRNQTELVKKLLNVLPNHAVLVVKPNPKSKYELSEELIATVEKNHNCVALQHSTKMDAVLPKVDLVVTVTGTIAIESVLSNKPVVTLVKTLNNTAKNCMYLPQLNQLPKIIDAVTANEFPKLLIQETSQFINLLNSKSYKGIVADPFNDANCIGDKNLSDMETAFLNVLK